MRTNIEIAIKAALEAGKRIMEIYENEDFSVEFKEDESPLTKADLAAHTIIVSALKETNIPILSEEGVDIPFEIRKDWKLLWIVDPLDGTKEFIKRNGEFTVNIALIEDHSPTLGVIYLPVLKELYFSDQGIGSFKICGVDSTSSISDIFKNSHALPIRSNRETYTIVASRSHLSVETVEFIKQLEEQYGFVETISKGSSIKLCMVAEGQAEIYPRFAPTMEWDIAAGHAICKYAGCTVIDFVTKNEMLYNREKLLNNWFIVTSYLK